MTHLLFVFHYRFNSRSFFRNKEQLVAILILMRPVLENTLLFLKGLALNIQPGPQSTSDASTVGIFRPELWNKA